MTILKNVTWFNLESSYWWVQIFDDMSLDQRIDVHKRFARNFPGGGFDNICCAHQHAQEVCAGGGGGG